MYPEDFEFRAENSAGISFFDNLVGNGWVREAIMEGKTVEEISSKWENELKQFKKTREEYLLY